MSIPLKQIRENVNQNNTIHNTNQYLSKLMTTGLSDINASFDNININEVINYLDKLDIK